MFIFNWYARTVVPNPTNLYETVLNRNKIRVLVVVNKRIINNFCSSIINTCFCNFYTSAIGQLIENDGPNNEIMCQISFHIKDSTT